MKGKRRSGILLAVSSLPSKYGVGDFGLEARAFIDLAKEAGFSLWQILPLNPLGYGNSPYQPYSSKAMDEVYISLDLLKKRGLIKIGEEGFGLSEAKRVDYAKARKLKEPYLWEAFEKETARNPGCLDSFIARNPWVKSWALYSMFHRENPKKAWNRWAEDKKKAIDDVDEAIQSVARESYLFEIWKQRTLFSQWRSLRRYARKAEVKIMGDIPFYVGYDSCDVWANQKAFLLRKSGKPSCVAGVPPDYFSATGQRWGNPIYDYKAMRDEGYSFLVDRIKGAGKMYDILRIDHFRAFDTYWKIPSKCKTAIDGKWVEAPGKEILGLVKKNARGLEIVAEDLGEMRDEVYKLRDRFKLPGMNVIQFTYNDLIYHGKKMDKPNMVAYLGTHDNETFLSFLDSLNPRQRWEWKEYLHREGFHNAYSDVYLFIEYLLSLEAKYAVVSMQDIACLDDEFRMNEPGSVKESNWTYRMRSFDDFAFKARILKGMNEKWGRI